MFPDIPGSGRWQAIEAVEKGWSADRKFKVTGEQGEALLLRVSDAAEYDKKQAEYQVISRFASLGFPQSYPVALGLCDGGRSVYMLLTWVEGDDLAQALPALPLPRQDALGQEAGRVLRAFHSLPLAAEDVPAATKKEKKLSQLKAMRTAPCGCRGDEAVIRFVRENIGSICLLPPCCLHGDFHPGNLVLRPGGQIGVIDFNRWKLGDPWEEFVKLGIFGVEASPVFCRGQINGYFQGEPPPAFWQALAVYAAHTALYSILWAKPFGQDEVNGMLRRYHRVLADYQGFSSWLPGWYQKQ